MKRNIKWKYLWIAFVGFLLLLYVFSLDLGWNGILLVLPVLALVTGTTASFLAFIESVLGSFFVQSNESARRHKIIGWIFSALCLVIYLMMAFFFEGDTWSWPISRLQQYMILAFAISAILAIVNLSLSKPTSTNSVDT